MLKTVPRVLRLFLGVVMLQGLAVDAMEDVLDRPALMLNDPARAAMLDVAQAGKRLVAVGERGVILISDDSGGTWSQIPVPTSVTLTRVMFVTPEAGWAVGHFGTVLRTSDGGRTWVRKLDGRKAAEITLRHFQEKLARSDGDRVSIARQIATAQQLVDDGPDKPFLDVYFEDTRHGFIVGAYNLIFATEDGGETWMPWQDRVENPRGLHLYAIRPSGAHWFIVGEQGLLLRSSDGAQSFRAQPSPYEGSFFGLITGPRGEVLVYGLRGNAFRSVDSGRTWTPVNLPAHGPLNAGLDSGGTMYLVDQTGQLLVSRDEGLTFAKVADVPGSVFTGLVRREDGPMIFSSLSGMAILRLAN
jgi:photosystem II stability/assembly factor-like uncharacterized protein